MTRDDHQPPPVTSDDRPSPPMVVAADSAGQDIAVAALRAGQPIVIPTDTVYGLAVSASHNDALDQLFELKRRPADRSIAVLVADLAQAETVVVLSSPARSVAIAHWPGALTLVGDRRAEINPRVGRDDGTVGVRCPDRAFVRELAARVGPLATTSANLSGEPTPVEAVEAARALAGQVAVVVDAGPCNGTASTVARIDDSASITILRQGAVQL